MCIIRWGGIAHRSITTRVIVAKKITQDLNFIKRKVAVIPKNVIMSGSRGALFVYEKVLKPKVWKC